MDNKLVTLLKQNWKTVVVTIFMIITITKLFHIENNTDSNYYEVESKLSSIESEVYQLRNELNKLRKDLNFRR